MLVAELVMHTRTCTHCIVYAPFMLTTMHPILMLVGKGRQLNLACGNFYDRKWPLWPCESEKQAII